MLREDKLRLGIFHNVSTRIVIFEKWKPLTIISIPIFTGTSRMRAVWTPELAQDLAAFQAIDAEAELTELLNSNYSNTQTRNVIIEKNKPYHGIKIWGTNTWTPQFQKDFYNMFGLPK